MSLTIEDFTVVSQLQPSEPVLSTDYFMVSQNDQNGYVSRKLQYSNLCATLLNDISGFINQMIGDKYDDLYLSVQTNNMNIQALNNTLSSAVCAIVKMANCIQTNKEHIKHLSSQISSTISSIDFLSTSVISIGADVSTIQDDMKTISVETSACKNDIEAILHDLSVLSTEVESISGMHSVTVDNNGNIYNELSVMKIPTVDYYDLVRSERTKENVLYVLDPTLASLSENNVLANSLCSGMFAAKTTQEMQNNTTSNAKTALKTPLRTKKTGKRKRRKTTNDATN